MSRCRRWGIVLGLGVAAGVAGVVAHPSAGGADGEMALARRAVSEDPLAAEAAIAQLRSRGPAGLEALFAVHSADVAGLRRGRRSAPGERVRHAIDRVSGQRDGHASGLYWHTDLEVAKAAARRTGRPILSLRLLGQLDEEMSCANSRYFRVVLYSDPQVARALAEGWVLHWSSERPAPRLTIDMGDGRTIERTITGNSVHYVLDQDGRPRDALVGLYAPRGFLAALRQASVAAACPADADLPACLGRAHAARDVELQAGYASRRAARGQSPATPTYPEALASLPGSSGAAAPSATEAMPLTFGKMVVETPVLRALGAPTAVATEEPDWASIGALTVGARRLSARTRGLLRLKTGERDIEAMAARLEEVARADGARNEVLFRVAVGRLFRDQHPSTTSFERLNQHVYTELLRTPADDPWLGLRADDVYDGVEVSGWR